MQNKYLPTICVSPDDAIREVLRRMSDNDPAKTNLPAGIVLVVDKNNTVLGIVTNGDLRRGLGNNMSLEDKAGRVMNKTPFLIEGPISDREMLARVMDKIKQESWHADKLNKIIVVDDNKKLLDVVSLYEIWHRSDTRFKHIGIVGLGYVGLTLGLTLADLGFKVKGMDANPMVESSLKKGKALFYEDGLETFLHDNYGKNFSVVRDFSEENNCDIYFITVGTPLDAGNNPDLTFLKNAAKHVGGVLRRGNVVILRSTVPMGSTRTVVIPILEKESGLAAGEGFLVAFAPERTIEGKALEELRHLPQVIGGFNRASADAAQNILGVMTHSIITVDSLEEAEMVKLVNNTYRDVTFAFANEVSLIAKRWGVDTKRVIDAANYGYDRSRVPMPSPGVGGYCLEKDPYIFINSANQKGYEPLLFSQARAVSERMVQSVAEETIAFLRSEKKEIKNPKILILGFAFKGCPVTSDVRGSMTDKVISALGEKKFTNIHGFDPAVRKEDIMHAGAQYVRDIRKGFENADLVLVMNNNSEFESLAMRELLAKVKKPLFLFDTWGIFSEEEVKKVKGVRYRRL